MNKSINKIISKHIANVEKVDTTQSLAKVVKAIDTITQNTYRELYNYRERKETPDKKKGHCC
mgnify:CR=1 FL=1|jgi:DNA-binding transcriptional regulator YhcF (GntR family)